jgi:hypothetical protein
MGLITQSGRSDDVILNAERRANRLSERAIAELTCRQHGWQISARFRKADGFLN